MIGGGSVVAVEAAAELDPNMVHAPHELAVWVGVWICKKNARAQKKKKISFKVGSF